MSLTERIKGLSEYTQHIFSGALMPYALPTSIRLGDQLYAKAWNRVLQESGGDPSKFNEVSARRLDHAFMYSAVISSLIAGALIAGAADMAADNQYPIIAYATRSMFVIGNISSVLYEWVPEILSNKNVRNDDDIIIS